jgi:hypothetical protein
MLATYLLPESVIREDGVSAHLPVEGSGLMQLTLGITRILEQGSLDVSVWGSADQEEWRQLAAFPQKFYCGTYCLFVDLGRHHDVRFLRASWKMRRWGKREPAPLFGFYVMADRRGGRHKHAGAA